MCVWGGKVCVHVCVCAWVRSVCMCVCMGKECVHVCVHG